MIGSRRSRDRGRRSAVRALVVAIALLATVGVSGIAESQEAPSSPTTTPSTSTSSTTTVPNDGTALDAAAIEALLRETHGGPPPAGVGDPDYFATKAMLEVFGTRFAGTWGPERVQTVALTSLGAGDDNAALDALRAAADRVGPVDEVRLVQHRYSLIELNETRRLVERVVRSFRSPPRGVGYGIDPIENRVEVAIDPDDAQRPEASELFDYAAANPDRLVIRLERLCPAAGVGSPTSSVATTLPECGGGAVGTSPNPSGPTGPGPATPATPVPAAPTFTG